MGVRGGLVSAVATTSATAGILIVAPPATQPIHMFWLCLVCALGIASGRATGSAWPGPAGAATGLAIVLLTLVWPVSLPGRTAAPPRSVDFAVGAARFTTLAEAMERTVPLPDEREVLPVYLRVDLARHYGGPARLRAEINGTVLGELGPESGAPGFQPPAGAPAWGLRVPPAVLRAAPAARVVLRPVRLDPALAVAVHPDPRISPAGFGPSRFFDGVSWRDDRLSGDATAPLRGAYRVWLNVR